MHPNHFPVDARPGKLTHALEELNSIAVFLDGVKLGPCLAADERQGRALVELKAPSPADEIAAQCLCDAEHKVDAPYPHRCRVVLRGRVEIQKVPK